MNNNPRFPRAVLQLTLSSPSSNHLCPFSFHLSSLHLDSFSCLQYKAQKKVKEHNRKQNRLERLVGGSRRVKKDPGIPNLHPFKEELLRKEELRRVAAEEAHEAERTRRKAEKQRAKQGGGAAAAAGGGGGLAGLVASAQKRGAEFEMLEHDASSAEMGELSEGSRKAYYREFRKVVDAADVLLEVLDARDPLGCRCASLERQVLAAGAGKRLVLVLNKVDLVPREIVAQWLKYLRNEFPVIAFKASTQSQANNLSQAHGDAVGGRKSGASVCFGAQTLLALMGNYCRTMDIRTSIRVGVVGYPNVGKSSIINSLKRSRVCGVGSTPGFTKSCQEIVLDKHVKLIDSPGIVFADNRSEGDMVLRNCVKLENLADPIAPVESILKRCQQAMIMEKYMVPTYKSTTEFLQHLARRLGRLRKGGIPDCESAARIILQDWNCGKISYYAQPPAIHTLPAHLASSVVAGWSKEFDLDTLAKDEEGRLAGSNLMRLEDSEGIPMAAGSVFQGDEFELVEAGMDGEEDDTPLLSGKTSASGGGAAAAGGRGAAAGGAYDFASDFRPAN